MLSKSIQHFTVETTSWSGGISWFPRGPRFRSAELAQEYIARVRDSYGLWRYSRITCITEPNKTTTIKEMFEV